jgi:catechol-2,3-dioxygenase
MKVNLEGTILYVRDVLALKAFYTTVFPFTVMEEYHSQWVLLQAGQGRLGLHEIGQGYKAQAGTMPAAESNSKIVFVVEEDLVQLRARLLLQNVPMRDIKTFDNYDYLLCDGEDPEGNVFQLKQRKLDRP